MTCATAGPPDAARDHHSPGTGACVRLADSFPARARSSDRETFAYTPFGIQQLLIAVILAAARDARQPNIGEKVPVTSDLVLEMNVTDCRCRCGPEECSDILATAGPPDRPDPARPAPPSWPGTPVGSPPGHGRAWPQRMPAVCDGGHRDRALPGFVHDLGAPPTAPARCPRHKALVSP